MRYSKLGTSGLEVSRVCLGTMTWGEQNTESEAYEQMDYAVGQGINFFDTAELYAVPTSQRTQGKTEEFIGMWFQKRGKRKDIILATKIGGIGVPWLRDGGPITGKAVREAVEGSLKRLQTDYIDLYQLHWPNREAPSFAPHHAGDIDFTAESTKEILDNLYDIYDALQDVVRQGKVRHIGLSDDTAWGIMKYLEIAKEKNGPRMVSIQNEFSLLRRQDDPYVAEVCVREDVAYLPWSPLACGLISGKYANGIPAGTRWEREKMLRDTFDSFRNTPTAHEAVAEYIAVAKKHGLDVCQMALKFCDMQNFVTSTIIGATKMEQLKSNIAAFDIELNGDVMKDIREVYRKFPAVY
jgi:aryl-alcohol dehydrogenase-like predicted oxidoreductase